MEEEEKEEKKEKEEKEEKKEEKVVMETIEYECVCRELASIAMAERMLS